MFSEFVDSVDWEITNSVCVTIGSINGKSGGVYKEMAANPGQRGRTSESKSPNSR